MSDPYIGEIRLLPYTYAPVGWKYCDGELLAISQFTMLFAVIGNAYGGDGRTTFALPNLKGRIAMGEGQGPGLSYYPLGATVGSTTVTLLPTQMPQHTHDVICDVTAGTVNSPAGAFIGKDKKSNIYENDPTSFVSMAQNLVGEAGDSQSHPNIQPFLVVNYCICFDGNFPSRN